MAELLLQGIYKISKKGAITLTSQPNMTGTEESLWWGITHMWVQVFWKVWYHLKAMPGCWLGHSGDIYQLYRLVFSRLDLVNRRGYLKQPQVVQLRLRVYQYLLVYVSKQISDRWSGNLMLCQRSQHSRSCPVCRRIVTRKFAHGVECIFKSSCFAKSDCLIVSGFKRRPLP